MYCVDQDGEVKSAISGSVVQEMPSQEDESVADDGETGSHPERVDILRDDARKKTTELFEWSFQMCPRRECKLVTHRRALWTTHATS